MSWSFSGFTLILSLLTAIKPGAESDLSAALANDGLKTVGKIIFSIGLGALLGWGLQLYTERSDFRLSWIIVGLSLLLALAHHYLPVKVLFCLISAGFVCENFGKRRTGHGMHRLERALNRNPFS